MSTPRTVLVTGGNRGIGFAIAERMIADGHRVAVTSRSGEGPEGSLTVRAEMTDAASIDAAFTQVEAQRRLARRDGGRISAAGGGRAARQRTACRIARAHPRDRFRPARAGSRAAL